LDGRSLDGYWIGWLTFEVGIAQRRAALDREAHYVEAKQHHRQQPHHQQQLLERRGGAR
jgi:hypothetical protein